MIPACISHEVINALREAPLFICESNYNALLGPKPSGIIGMSGFLVMGIVLKYSLQGTTQGRYLTGGVPPVRFSM